MVTAALAMLFGALTLAVAVAFVIWRLTGP